MLVSVLIPAYNHEKYIEGTVRSIIRQTYKDIELIIVDDGSKDGTWTKMQELKEECDNRFVNTIFETKQNEGTCKTLNRLLSLASGDYIYIIASDDVAKPQAIEKEVLFLNNNPDYGLVVGDNEYIDANGVVCYKTKKDELVYDKANAKYLTAAEKLASDKNFSFKSDRFGSYDTLYYSNYIPNGYLIRKSVFDKIGKFTPEAPLEDWYMMLQIAKYYKFEFLDEVLFSYRMHGNNTISNIEKMYSMTEITRQYEEKILANINEKEVLPVVVKTKKFGYCYKSKGIPNVFEKNYLKRNGKTIKQFRLFNIPIFECEKN